MARYFARPKADWDESYPLIPDLHVPDNKPVRTGVIDNRGNDIWRAPNPIGFGRMEEWG